MAITFPFNGHECPFDGHQIASNGHHRPLEPKTGLIGPKNTANNLGDFFVFLVFSVFGGFLGL